MARMDYWEVVDLCVALGLCHFAGLSAVPILKDPEVASAAASFWAVGLLFDGSPEMGCVCVVWRCSINSTTLTSLCWILYCPPSIHSVAAILFSNLYCSASLLAWASAASSALWLVHQIHVGRSGLLGWNYSKAWRLLTNVSVTDCLCHRSMLLVAFGWGSLFHLSSTAWASMLLSRRPWKFEEPQEGCCFCPGHCL